jgi:hypothetical protein
MPAWTRATLPGKCQIPSRRHCHPGSVMPVCVTLAVSSSNEVSSGAGGVALMATRRMHIFSTLTLFL